jgi:hypothetical protein
MSGLLNQMVSMGKAALQRMQSPPDPNLVRPVDPSALAPVPTLRRSGPLVLYGPKEMSVAEAASAASVSMGDGLLDPPVKYEIVLHTEKGNCYR